MKNTFSKNRIVVIALIAACGLAIAAAHARDSAPAPPTVPDPDPERFAHDIRDFAAWDRQNAFPHDAILFIGSSSIDKWQTADAFPGLPVLNRGFGGSQISDVNHYFNDVVTKYRPKIIVFYSGDNDTAAGKSPQQIFSDFAKFVGLVHQSLPDTHIIGLPIKPSLARWDKWPQMQQANALAANLDKHDDRLEIIDTATPLLGPDGKPRKELFVADGLHLNASGYAIWNKILTPILNAAMSQR